MSKFSKRLTIGLSITACIFLLLAIYSMIEPAGKGELGGTLKFGAIVVALGLSGFCAILALLTFFWRRKSLRYTFLLLALSPIIYFAAIIPLHYIQQQQTQQTLVKEAERSHIIADIYLNKLTTLGTDIEAYEKLGLDFEQHLVAENISPLMQRNSAYFGWTRNMYILTFVKPDYFYEALYFTKVEYCTAFIKRFSEQLQMVERSDVLIAQCGKYY